MQDPKYTIEQLKNVAIARKGRCLSTEYVHARFKLKWQCKKGHTWDNTPALVVEHKSWCKQCIKDSYLEELYEIAESRGGKCLSTEYINNSTKLQWKCHLGHLWNANANNVKHSESWCPICANGTIEEMQELAANKGGKCLSKKYIHSHVKLKWGCKEGHVWQALPSAIKQGEWCPLCAIKNRADKLRDTIGNMRLLAIKRNGKCLSKSYGSGRDKLKWECRLGHKWFAAPDSIRKGTWCPICSRSLTNKNLVR